ncbi:hypothetical protein VNO78_08499 [Psophocarpus tetragonolobus]|uniref:Plant heme peroxidase family profile domain-containing protein n=1 Tax=Psophocarpus tetragonolobus TaxID=3891 RepID=A0AAN9SY22_PSOTE
MTNSPPILPSEENLLNLVDPTILQISFDALSGSPSPNALKFLALLYSLPVLARTLTMAEVDEEYLKEIEMARTEFRTFITNNKCAPLMLQLAWSDAATYDARRGTGGPNGSVRLRKQGLKNEESKRLDIAVRYCGQFNFSTLLSPCLFTIALHFYLNWFNSYQTEIVKTKLTLKRVSYADLFQLAGVVAVQVTEGPTIDFVPGRKDSNECPRTEWRFLNGEEGK